MQQPYDIVGSYTKDELSDVNPGNTVNLYEVIDPTAMNGHVLKRTEGTKLTKDLKVEHGGRGSLKFNDIGYFVIGHYVFSIDIYENINNVGQLESIDSKVWICHNKTQLMFTDGVYGYVYTPSTSVFQKIVHPDFPAKPSFCASFGNRGCVGVGDTNRMQVSAIEDYLTWDASVYASNSVYGDVVNGAVTVGNRMYVFGRESIEPWYIVNDVLFPYAVDMNGVRSYGLESPKSLSDDLGEGIALFLSTAKSGVGSIKMIEEGSLPRTVSTRVVDCLIQSLSNPSDVSSYVHKNNGYLFCTFNWTTDNLTLCYCITTNRWFKKQYKKDLRHFGENHLFVGNKHYLTHYNQSYLYEFSTNYFDDDGVNINRVRVGDLIYDKTGKKITLNRFNVELHQGVGAVTGEEKVPQVLGSFSIDRGHVFGNRVRADIGRIGLETYNTIFTSCATSHRGIVPRIETSAKVDFTVLGAWIDITLSDKGV
jgi:hypothetical protein